MATSVQYYCVVKALRFACGLQKNINSLMKPTSSVQQLIVHKPECRTGLVALEPSGSRLDHTLIRVITLIEFLEGGLH